MKKILIITAIFLSGCATTQPQIVSGLENTPEIEINSPQIIQLVTGGQNEKD